MATANFSMNHQAGMHHMKWDVSYVMNNKMRTALSSDVIYLGYRKDTK